MMYDGVTGTLLHTMIPGRRRRKWININKISDVVTGSGVIGASGLITPSAVLNRGFVSWGEDTFPEDIIGQSYAMTELNEPTNSLHIVYFVNTNDENAGMDVNALQSGLYMLQTRYADINLHQYPYHADWPAPLIANLRDACLLSQELVDGYKEDDILLFVHKPDDTRSYEITGHALACVLAASEKGSSLGLLHAPDNQTTLEVSSLHDKTGSLSDADINPASTDGHSYHVFKNMTVAFTCRYMMRFAGEILRVIADHSVDPNDPFPQISDYTLLNSILSKVMAY